jgi:uncharacterized membrane protein
MERDWPDLCGGLALAGLGAAAAGWAVAHYDIGTLRQMGPGFFPAVLGAVLVVLGLMVALPALHRVAPPPRLDIGVIVAVLAAILIFGLGLSRLGLAGATALSVLVASIPAPRAGWRWRIILCLCVAVLTVLVFSVGLQMTLPVWPRLS